MSCQPKNLDTEKLGGGLRLRKMLADEVQNFPFTTLT